MAYLDFLATAFAYASIWLLWQMVRGFICRSPLDNIPGPASASILKGNMLRLFDRHDWKFLEELTEGYGSVVKIHDIFGQKMLWVFDPLALHHITIKEQDVFQLAREKMTIRRMLAGPALPATLGDHHRRQRKILNPVFSIANMRHLTPIFYATINRLRNGLSMQLKKNGEGTEVDLNSWMGRTALELIGQGGLGYSFDSLTEPTYDAYGDAIKRLGPAQSKTGTWRLAFMFSYLLPLPHWLKGYLIDLVPNKGIQELKATVDTAWTRSIEIYNEKRHALLAGDEALKRQVGEGKDIMSVLLRANLEAAPEDRLPEEEVIAQCRKTFTFAGTETTSNALARILHILSERQDVQDKLREEIIEARNGQDISHDQLVELPFLDAICRETLRLYSPVSFVSREAVCDARLPLSQPLRGIDGTVMNEIVVPKGTRISVGVYSSNRNKAIWGDDALEWKPERWINPLLSSVNDAKIPGVYSNLMTFFGGGRACIGFKFAQLEMKVVLSVLLESFRFLPSGKEIVWNRGNVTYPTVGLADKATLPLKVEFAKAVNQSTEDR